MADHPHAAIPSLMPLIPQQHLVVQHMKMSGPEPAKGALRAQMDALPVNVVSLVSENSWHCVVVEEV